MANPTESPDGKPRKDPGRPSPDVERYSTDGQSDPRGADERGAGQADEAPRAGDQLAFEDDELPSGRGNPARTGGTWKAQGADRGEQGPPSAGGSGRNGPSDPDRDERPS